MLPDKAHRWFGQSTWDWPQSAVYTTDACVTAFSPACFSSSVTSNPLDSKERLRPLRAGVGKERVGTG